MKILVNGQSQVPPGFRFHPTEEELLQYYLRKRISDDKIDLDVIRDVDLNKLEPWDIQEMCKIGTTPQNDWYFFSHKDKKYPTGTRTNRATTVGFCKATGRDKIIYSNGNSIGMRKTLVFYQGRAPQGQKSNWIMHEYRLDENVTISPSSNHGEYDLDPRDVGWVVCRVFMKKMLCKTSSTRSEETIEKLYEVMGQSCKEEVSLDPFLKLPSLDRPMEEKVNRCHVSTTIDSNLITSWAALDRLIGPNSLSIPTVEEIQPSPFYGLNQSGYYDTGLMPDYYIPSPDMEIWNDNVMPRVEY